MTAADHLLRELAPIPAHAWTIIDSEAKQRLTPLLAARRIVDFYGPSGWKHDRRSTGRTNDLADLPSRAGASGLSGADVQPRQRRVLPITEVKVPFVVARHEIADMQRGAADAALDDLDRAVRVAATVENTAVIHGWPAAGIEGIIEQSSFDMVELGNDPATYPHAVATAVDQMRLAGVGGPYALAIEPARYTLIVETAEHHSGPLIEHLHRILQGPVIWSPGIEGAVLVSQRGGDFAFDVGQDWSIGYHDHRNGGIELYLEQSFTFSPTEPDAAIGFA